MYFSATNSQEEQAEEEETIEGGEEEEGEIFQLAYNHSEHQSSPLRAMMDLTVQCTVKLWTGLAKPNMDRIANQEAIIMQAVGTVERQSCKHCSKGEGLFSLCVRV
jgi:hypothetical protein